MTANTNPESRAVAQAGRLRGFASGARELDDAAVEVRGELPAWLRGGLLLNGPALWDLPGGSYAHWFDGLAMLHRVSLGQGAPRYRSRFLRSRDYVESVAAQRPTRAGFGTDDVPGLWRRLRGIFAPEVTDNAAVVMAQVAGGWAAATETPHLIGFDPVTLATTGALQFTDRERMHLMAAHGINDAQGNYWNVGIEFGPQCTYKVFRVPPGALRREVVGTFKSKEPGYLHAFALTPRHAIVWEPAWRAQPLQFMFSGKSYMDHFAWKPAQGSTIHAVALDGSGVKSWQVPPLMAFHAVQAYEAADETVLELVIFDDATVTRELALDARRRGTPLRSVPKLVRYRLRPGAGHAQPEALASDLELPQVHPSCWTQRQAHVAWGAGARTDEPAPFFDRTLRVDLATGETVQWQRGGAIQLEPLFVAPPGSRDEDEGVLLVPTLADGDAGTVVCVLDALRLECMAELHLPQVVPFGFHAAFHPA